MKANKSKFIAKKNQIDNEADVSVYSETSFAFSSKFTETQKIIPVKSGFVCK